MKATEPLRIFNSKGGCMHDSYLVDQNSPSLDMSYWTYAENNSRSGWCILCEFCPINKMP